MKLKDRIKAFEKLEHELMIHIEGIYVRAIQSRMGDETFCDWWMRDDNDNIVIDCFDHKHYMSAQYQLPIDVFEKLKCKEDYKKYLKSLEKKALQTTVFEIIEENK